MEDHFAIDPTTGVYKFKFPIAGVPFKPRHAYKALVKMAVALLPDEELANYQKLKSWLLDIDDKVDFPVLEVALSFGTIGNSPPFVYGALLRRIDPTDEIPHILFLFSAGSVAVQIDLRSDCPAPL
jgi:tetrahydromethanopterin S-methyltransferase subunit G